MPATTCPHQLLLADRTQQDLTVTVMPGTHHAPVGSSVQLGSLHPTQETPTSHTALSSLSSPDMGGIPDSTSEERDSTEATDTS